MMLRTTIPVTTLAVLAALVAVVRSQEPGRPPAAPAQRCAITGSVVAGQTRLPGVAITITPAGGGAPVTTSTGPDGHFSAAVPASGEYRVKADLASFFADSLSVTLGTPCQAQADITMTLASRVVAPAPPAAAPAAAAAGAPPTTAGVRAQTPASGTPAGRRPQAPQFQALAPVLDATGAATGDPGAVESLDREAAAQ
ncbi:MAG: carboxypeptidase-like regulatory domain-containing protein, partial [Vicinamibacterales bacterium]|nr:carboxypeptidase-like regulatory domain-containing protein [Vicinamibacterales bacterium]